MARGRCEPHACQYGHACRVAANRRLAAADVALALFAWGVASTQPEADAMSGIGPTDSRRQNRALHRLKRDPEATRRQLWHIGAGEQTLDALVQAGAIATNGDPDTFRLTERGADLLASRPWPSTY